MRLVFKFIFILSVALGCDLSQAALNVVVDPGHGGTDTGAVYGKAREAEISLSVAQELKKLLSANSQFEASMTRTQNQNVSLQDRVEIAEKTNADLFISIHTNASPDYRARGVEFYFQNQLPPDEESLFLANSENQAIKEMKNNVADDFTKKGDVLAIVEDLKRRTKMHQSHILSKKLLASWAASPQIGYNGHKEGSTIRQAPFFVISKTNVPSVLVELGFISNPKEAERLVKPAVQKEIAQRIYQGILSYKEMIDRTEVSRLH